MEAIMNTQQKPEAYLGDGLYAKFDGWNFWLRAPRETGDHYVAMEPEVLASFLEFVRKARPELRSIGGWSTTVNKAEGK
jgi:hypothetical protein